VNRIIEKDSIAETICRFVIEAPQIARKRKAGNFVIVTTDADFYELATTAGPPPKVVWLRRWRHPTSDAEWVLRREAVRITAFAADPELAVLVLDRD